MGRVMLGVLAPPGAGLVVEEFRIKVNTSRTIGVRREPCQGRSPRSGLMAGTPRCSLAQESARCRFSSSVESLEFLRRPRFPGSPFPPVPFLTLSLSHSLTISLSPCPPLSLSPCLPVPVSPCPLVSPSTGRPLASEAILENNLPQYKNLKLSGPWRSIILKSTRVHCARGATLHGQGAGRR